jgi:hypothetical protein
MLSFLMVDFLVCSDSLSLESLDEDEEEEEDELLSDDENIMCFGPSLRKKIIKKKMFK